MEHGDWQADGDGAIAITKEIFNKIGNFGIYQKVLFVFIIYTFLGWACLGDAGVFLLTAEPPWECQHNSTICNITWPVYPGQPNYEYRCTIPRKDWKFVDEYTSLITQVIHCRI